MRSSFSSSLRPDRLLTLAMAGPLRALGVGPRESRLPVLMYHRVADDPESDVASYYRVCTSPARFAEQMAWLAAEGWKGVSLSAALRAGALAPAPAQEQGARRDAPEKGARNEGVNEKESTLSPFSLPPSPEPPAASCGGRLGGRLVALTFDDGFRDFYDAAFPILSAHGFGATMYLPTAYIGENRKSFKGHDCLTWTEVRTLAAAGIEFGSHTVNHPKLVEQTWPEIETELGDSKAEIEQRLGLPVRSFAYPYAFPQTDRAFTASFRTLLTDCGYESHVTTIVGRIGATTDRLMLPRLPANSADDHTLFTAKLAGAYDWLAWTLKARDAASQWLHPSPSP